ncbi:MAG: IPT/TIG domain-containing protein [Armatimonadota bacterium]
MQIQKRKLFIILLILIFSMLLIVRGYTQETPKIDKVFPDTAPAGEMVFIRGSGFTADKSKVKVFFGDKTAKIVVAAEKSIAVEVPEGIEECDVIVEIDGKKSNPAPFKLGEKEDITSKAPRIKITLTVTDPIAKVGKTITGTFKVTGTENPVEINFKNQSPDVVALPDGNEQTVITSGGSENIYSFEIKALTGPRTYDISYNWKTCEIETTSKKETWETIDLTKKPSMEKNQCPDSKKEE